MNKYFLFILTIFIFSCKGEKLELIVAYNELQSVIDEFDAIKIYSRLDTKSKEYVDFLLDSTNNDYSKMKIYGESVGYPLFTTIYHKSFSDTLKSDGVILDKFMLHLRLNRVPMFSAFQETKLLEDQISVGEKKYVTVALKVGENIFITSKVFFTKENDEYKFNLLSLLQTSERLYKQQFQKYVKNHQRNLNGNSSNEYESSLENNYPDDLLKSFLAEMDESENRMSSFSYRK